ncbi:hypothetical protein V5799_015806 [Amblyomma americanum]|uniref:Integrase catalytic domain-containing protein n=1 Tax=Amblyomma americanum TaxID=6943 RepID=A0AAQ4F7K0_AMBAM
MPTYGALEPFHGQGGAWTEYLERDKLLFDANSVPEEKKKSVFLTCCGSSTYSLLRSLLTSKTADQVSIDEIFSMLSGHYIPKPSVVVCRFRFNSRSRQPEESASDYTASLKKLSANSDATIRCLRTIFCTHGIPDIIVSDNGTAFTSEKYADFLSKNGIRRILIPPYHPASNGAAERVVQTIKGKLKKAAPGDFQTNIDRILLSYRTKPHAFTGSPPAELLLSRQLQTPIQRMHPSLRAHADFKQLKQKMRCDSNARKSCLPSPGEPVFVRNFRPGPAWIAGTVRHLANSSLQIELEDGTLWNRHADHVRPRRTPGVLSDDEEPLPALAATTDTEQLSPPRCSFSAEPSTTASARQQQTSAAPLHPQLRRSTLGRKPVIYYGL